MKDKKKLSRQEKEILFKGFFLRFKQGNFSPKENAIIDRLLRKYRSNKKKIELTRDQVDEAEKRFRIFLQREIPELRTAQTAYKYRRQNRALVRYGMAAAAVLLLIVLNLPVVRNTILQHTETLTAQTLVTDSFTTQRNIRSLQLSDGTVVYLNVNSKLTLRKDKFTAQTREVWLDEGEAFFDVAKDSLRPFIVHTADGLQTRVLGTSFNIKAYNELTEQVVSVRTGKVQVSTADGEAVQLTPDQKADFNKTTGVLTQGVADSELSQEWRKGKIIFVDAGLKEFSMRLKQYYDVEVVVKGNALPQAMELNAVYHHSTPPKEIARAVAKSFGVRYEMKGDVLVFGD
ncbi:MAG: hypothetical protein GX361_03865 [Bacteroidales bacterium]|nr:hypothetical protein [Bacteroidales bacterium]